MEYIVLTETDFFRRINEADSLNDLCSSYRDFTDRVIQLCMGGMNLHHAVLALIHVETELQFHRKFYGVETDSVSGLYIRKALAFVRRTGVYADIITYADVTAIIAYKRMSY